MSLKIFWPLVKHRQYSVLSSDIGDQVEVNGNWGTIGQPGFGIPVTIKLTGMSIASIFNVSMASQGTDMLQRRSKLFFLIHRGH